MRTDFTPQMLADPHMAGAASAIRACVHCGICTATCPTYLLLGDERDSPRGRIALAQAMLEADAAPPADAVAALDRCLSCMGCKTACPSGVDYARVIDQAREHIEKHHTRPFGERVFRTFLPQVLKRRWTFAAALNLASIAAPLLRLMPERLRHLAAMAPAARSPQSALRTGVHQAQGKRVMRVALMRGCVQRTLAPEIDHATVRLLNRMGVEVVVPPSSGCCGAIEHHLGQARAARRTASRNVAAWWRESERDGLDRIVVNASGCGTMVKDYGHVFAGEEGWEFRARRLADKTVDVSELIAELGFRPKGEGQRLRVAYHAACSLQHGQKIVDLPAHLLAQAGFTLTEVPDSHLCCGSAGSYSILQPEIAAELRARKAANLKTGAPQVVAGGNMGCLEHLRDRLGIPAVHTIELLDWAAGGPKPWRLKD